VIVETKGTPVVLSLLTIPPVAAACRAE